MALLDSSDWPIKPWDLQGTECSHEGCRNFASFACCTPTVAAVCTAHLANLFVDVANEDGLDIGMTPFTVVVLREDSDDPI